MRDNFVRPFITAFPGHVNVILNLAYGKNLVAVEWSFEGVHAGSFGNVEATGKQVQVPGCSFYEYDLAARMIPAGRSYFDVATLLRQIGAERKRITVADTRRLKIKTSNVFASVLTSTHLSDSWIGQCLRKSARSPSGPPPTRMDSQSHAYVT